MTRTDRRHGRLAGRADHLPRRPAPDRRRRVDTTGVGIAAYEWGDEDAPAAAPRPRRLRLRRHLRRVRAAAGRRRLARRGVGPARPRRLASTPRSTAGTPTCATRWPCSTRADRRRRARARPLQGRRPACMQLADACPHRVQPPRQPRRPPVAAARARRRRPRAHAAAGRPSSTAGSTTAGARPTASASRARSTSWPRRRGRMNPRLSHRVAALPRRPSVPARTPTAGAGRSIPSMRFGGFGPWRPEWSMLRLPGLGDARSSACSASRSEEMGWGTRPEDVVPYLPPGAPSSRRSTDVGHFVHIEQPDVVADLVLDVPRVTAVTLAERR